MNRTNRPAECCSKTSSPKAPTPRSANTANGGKAAPRANWSTKSAELDWLRTVKRQARQRRHRGFQTECRRLSTVGQCLRQSRRGLYGQRRPGVGDQKLRTLRRVGPRQHERDRDVEETAREQTRVNRKSAESHA